MRHRLLTACRPTATDALLARRAAAGDDDAFEKLYVRYQPRLEAYCRSIVRHDEDARDAVQNAMTKALVALRRDNPANVQGWLFRIAHNEAISLLRRRRPTSELVDVMHDGRLGPAGDLLMREELRATLDNVRALPPNLQHPLLLRELAGLSYGQVAEVVGGTPAAARKAVFDARTALSADRAGRDEACSVIRQSLSEGDGRRRRARVVRSHLQSCQSCCAWESEQRQRRYHLASLLPAASAAGTAGGWLAGLFGGGTTVAAGVSGSLATNAKVAASLAVIAAGAAPVVEHVERNQPATTIGASAAPAVTTPKAARRAVAAATASRAAAAARAASTRAAPDASRAAAGTRAAAARAAPDSSRAAAGARAVSTRAAAGANTRAAGSRPAARTAAGTTSAGRDRTASQRGAARDAAVARRGTGDRAAGPRTNELARRSSAPLVGQPRDRTPPQRDGTGLRDGPMSATAMPAGASVDASPPAGRPVPPPTTSLAARPTARDATSLAARRTAPAATSLAARRTARDATSVAARLTAPQTTSLAARRSTTGTAGQPRDRDGGGRPRSGATSLAAAGQPAGAAGAS